MDASGLTYVPAGGEESSWLFLAAGFSFVFLLPLAVFWIAARLGAEGSARDRAARARSVMPGEGSR